MLRIVRAFLMLALALVGGASTSFANPIATATYTATQTSPGLYTYSLTLNNTGTTNIGTFWFSWVPGAGYLSPIPNSASITSPAGWTFGTFNGGASIRWVTTTSLLASGTSLSGFSFTSAETPTQLASTSTVGSLTNPGAVFYVYEGTPLNTASYQSVATPAAATVTPEPGTLALVFTGLSGTVMALRRRLLS